MDSQDGFERRTVVYFGQVQGVGFRWTTRQLASGFEVSGFVRNREDGSVELVVEGAIRELDRFLSALHDRMDSYIRNMHISTSPGTAEFDTFVIRH